MSLEELLEKIGELPNFDQIRPLTPLSKTIVGDTPLHVAAVWGDLTAIELLVQSGADINAIGDMGYTPLHEAVEQGHANAVQLLVRLGANLDMIEGIRMTPLELANLIGAASDVKRALIRDNS